MRALYIVQPYVPRYRVQFFERLREQLARDDIRMVVVAGVPDKQQMRRGDSNDEFAWVQPFAPRRLAIGRRTLHLGGSRTHWKSGDAVILGLQGSDLDAHLALWGQPEMRVGLWGHVRSYVTPSNPLDYWIERFQARRAQRVFAYTSSGAAEAVRMGAPAGRVTTVMNSVATDALLRDYTHLRAGGAKEFISSHELNPAKTLGYVGGLDASKRVDLLAAALDRLWASDPEIRLIVGGRGAHEGRLEPSIRRGQTIHLGYAHDREIALIGAVSQALLNPGRIGLVAVQALAMGIPVITTDYQYHGPEREYLADGVSVLRGPGEPAAYADKVRDFLATGRGTDAGSWHYPTLSAMVRNFAAGAARLVHD